MAFRHILAVLALSVWPATAPAQQAADGIETVIRDQISDFQADDWEGAFDHASQMIQRLFGTPDNFGQMVQRGYPMVWRPADVRFGETRSFSDRMLQTVVISDQAGAIHVLEYEMIPVGDGWKINGVRLMRAPQLGA